MSITSDRANGKEVAACACVKCNTIVNIPALHGTTKGQFTGSNLPPLMHIDRVRTKLRKQGWYITAKREYCPTCAKEMKHANKKEKPVQNVKPIRPSEEPLRQPSRQQKREIVDLLTEVYDVDAQRYKGSETDQSVADTLGNDILWGWVSQLRDEFFGPDGNEADNALVKSVDDLVATVDKCLTDARAAITSLQTHMRELAQHTETAKQLKEKLVR